MDIFLFFFKCSRNFFIIFPWQFISDNLQNFEKQVPQSEIERSPRSCPSGIIATGVARELNQFSQVTAN